MDFRIQSQKGFSAVLILTLLPALLAFFFLVHLGIGFIQFELRLNHVCRQTHINTQNKVGVYLKKLLELNPKALKLRQAEALAQKAVLAAVGTPAYPAAQARLLQVQLQRQMLAQQQQELLRISNQTLIIGFERSRKGLHREQQSFTPSLRPLLSTQFALIPGKAPRLAVRPDFPDTAPAYFPENDFEEQQALVQKWQYNVKVSPLFKFFLDGQFKFEKDCAVTLSQEALSWTAKIHKVRSSPKSPW
ncbi:hypothetical protein D3C87_176310 [compost metagenome]